MTKPIPITRIRRLLALAGSDNENESKTAMAKAQELCAEYHLTVERVQDMEADPETRGYIKLTIEEGKRAPLHMKFVGGICTKFFFVKAIAHVPDDRLPAAHRAKYLVHLCGRPHDVAIAQHVYLYLRATYKRLWLEYRKAHGIAPSQTAVQTSYYQGLTHGVIEALKEARAKAEAAASAAAGLAIAIVPDEALMGEAQALVGVSEARPYVQAEPIVQRKMDVQALRDGYVKGKTLSVDPAVAGEGQTGESGEVDVDEVIPGADRQVDSETMAPSGGIFGDLLRTPIFSYANNPAYQGPVASDDFVGRELTCWSCQRRAPYFRQEVESERGVVCVFCKVPITGKAAAGAKKAHDDAAAAYDMPNPTAPGGDVNKEAACADR